MGSSRKQKDRKASAKSSNSRASRNGAAAGDARRQAAVADAPPDVMEEVESEHDVDDAESGNAHMNMTEIGQDATISQEVFDGGGVRVLSKRNILELFSAEIIEKIGMCIGPWMYILARFNSITAMRMYAQPYTGKIQRMPASLVSMLPMQKLIGAPYDIRRDEYHVDSDDELPGEDGCLRLNANDALLFPAMDRICRQKTESTRAGRLIREIVKRYPQALFSQNDKGCTPLHEFLKRPYWRHCISTHHLLSDKNDPMRSTAGVEQRLIQNKKGFTALHLALMYSKNLSVGDLNDLVDERKEVLCMPSVEGLIPLKILFMRQIPLVSVESVLTLLHDANDTILRHNPDRSGTCLHFALAAGNGKFPTADVSAIQSQNEHRRVRALLPVLIPLLIYTTDSDVLLAHQCEESGSVQAINRECSHIPLHLALLWGMEHNIIALLIDDDQKTLFTHTASDSAGHLQGDLPIHLAIKTRRPLSTLKILIDTHASVLLKANFAKDCALHTALRRAAIKHRTIHDTHYGENVLIYLIERGMASNADFLLTQDGGHDTALHLAARHDASYKIMQTLVSGDKRALTTKNTFGGSPYLVADTPLHVALKHRVAIDVLKLLVDDNEDVLHLTNSAGDLPLHIAVGMSEDIISLLIPKSEDMPDARKVSNSIGRTPLHCALAAFAPITTIRLLLDSMAVFMTDENDLTPLHQAILCNASTEVVALLIQSQSLLSVGETDPRLCLDADGRTPLHLAVQAACIDVRRLSLLIDPGKKTLLIRNQDGDTAYHMAAHQKAHMPSIVFDTLWTMIPALDETQPAVDVRLCVNLRKNTPLHLACMQSKDIDTLRLLLDPQRSALDMSNCNKRMPLHIYKASDIAITKLLVTDSNLSKVDELGNTPLHSACEDVHVRPEGKLEILMCTQNDLLRTVNDVGSLPIHMLFKNANCAKIATIAEMKTLLPVADAGSPHLNRQDVRLCRNEAGATALDLVVRHRTNNFDMMCLLVHGADESLLCPRHTHSPLHAYLLATNEKNVRKNAIRLLRGEDHKVLLLRNTSISDELPVHTALRMHYDISIISMLLPPLYSDRSMFSGASDAQVDALHTRARLSALHQYQSSNPHSGGLLTRGSFVHNTNSPLRFAMYMQSSPPVLNLIKVHFEALFPLTQFDDSGCTIIQTAVQRGSSASILNCMVDSEGKVLFIRAQTESDTPLHRLLKWNDMQRSLRSNYTMRALMRAASVLVDTPRLILLEQNASNETPLHLALQRYVSHDLVRLLLDAVDGVPRCRENVEKAIMLQNNNGCTALHLALNIIAAMHHLDNIQDWCSVCKLLLNPVVLMKVDFHGDTPLHLAVNLQLFPQSDKLCLIDVDQEVLRVQNKTGANPFHLALEHILVKDEMPLWLIDDKQEVLLQQNKNGRTPLLSALHQGFLDVTLLKHLVDKDEKVLVRFDNSKCTPLHAALKHADKCSVPLILMLLSNAHAVDIIKHKATNGRTALLEALAHDADISIVRILLTLSPFPHERSIALLHQDSSLQTALHIALKERAPLSITRLLIDPQRKVLTRFDAFHKTPLHVALLHDVYLPEALIFVDTERTVLIESVNATREQPLHLALRYTPADRYVECLAHIPMLIDIDQNLLVYADDFKCNSPLHIALRKIPLDLLLTSCDGLCHLIDVNQRVLTMQNYRSKTPLHIVLKRLPRDVDMKCLELLGMLVDKEQEVLDVGWPENKHARRQFELRMTNRDDDKILDKTVVRAIFQLLTRSPRA